MDNSKKSRSHFLPNWSLFSIITVLVPIAALILGAFSININRALNDGLSQEWAKSSQDTLEKGKFLHDLDYHFGYGGLIHNFKNYVLRGDEGLLPVIQEKGVILKNNIRAYEPLNLSPEEQAALNAIEEIIDLYLENTKVAQDMREQGVLSPLEIDKVVRINDQPALEALNTLENEWEKSQILRTDQLTQLSQEMQGSSRFSTFSLLALIAVSLLLVWLAFRDSYRQREASKVIKEREKELLAVISGTAEGIIVINDKGIIELINPAAVELFGYKYEEMIGQNVSILLPPGERKDHDTYIEASNLHFPRIINQSRDLKGHRKDGKEFDLELNVAPINSQGKRRFVGVFRDIGVRKKREAIMEETKKVAEANNRAKNLFLAQMNHELRTPLNAIMGFAQVVGRFSAKPLDKKQSKYIEHISEGGEHLLGLINSINDISQIEAGTFVMSLEPVDVKAVVDRALTYVQTQADNMNITIENLITNHSLKVKADVQRLSQVLINLFSNAIKYNVQDGRVTIRIKEYNKSIIIEIEDTGIGIPDDKRELVFTAFERLGREESEVSGSGIGLALSKQLTKAMGGELYFESKVNKGSSFTVELPVADNIPPAHLVPKIEKTFTETTLGDPKKTYKIIYVEDNPLAVLLLQDILNEFENISLEIAETPKDCMDMVLDKLPDLLILDIDLPQMSGTDLYHRISGIFGEELGPVIALSAVTESKRVNEALSYGFKAYLTKPIDVDKLLYTLNKYLH